MAEKDPLKSPEFWMGLTVLLLVSFLSYKLGLYAGSFN